ncbi:MAG: hypothetical protein KJO40_13430 [Deltaproteobacteria bacterium]|nr:hypothetical protein [Deltaproteobacteria bacterium]
MSSARRGGVDNIILISGGAGNPQVLAGTVDPTLAGGIPAPEGSLYLRYVASGGEQWTKFGVADTSWQLTQVSAVAATWGAPGSVRYYAVDYDAGSDSNIGYSDVDMATAGTVALKTLERLRQVFPPVGNGRRAVIAIAARAGGAVYRNIANTLDDEMQLVGVTGYEYVLVRGTGNVATAGAVKFANDAADKVALGAQIFAGTNAAGYNPIAPISAGTFDVQLSGGGAPGLAAEPSLIGKRVRFDSATTTVALRNACGMIHANDTDTITLARNLPATPVAADVFYIEEPATTVFRIQAAGCQGATTALLPSFSPTGITFAGLRSSEASAGFVAVGCRGISGSIRLSFVESYSPGFSCSSITDCDKVTVTRQYVDEAASTIEPGTGFVAQGWAGTISQCGSLSMDATVSRVGRYQILGVGPQALNIGTGAGCYFAAGLLFQNCKGSGGTDNTVGGNVVGSNASGAVRRTRLLGGFAGSCVSVTNSFIFLRGLDIQNVGALSIISLFGLGTLAVINDVVGSAGNTGNGLDMTLNRNSMVLLGQLNANTFTGGAGRDIAGKGPVYYTHADVARTDVIDKALNYVQGSASTKLGSTARIINDGNANIGQYKIVRATGAGVVRVAQANTAANAAGIVGVGQSAFTTVQEAMAVQAGGTWVQFDVAPTVGGIAYLSTGTAGNAQHTVPALAATNQKLRLGRILDVSGTLGFVAFTPEIHPILADGAA